MKRLINQRKLRARYCSLSEKYLQLKKESAKFNVDDFFLEDLNEFIRECNAIMMSREYRDEYKSEAQYLAKCVLHIIHRLESDE